MKIFSFNTKQLNLQLTEERFNSFKHLFKPTEYCHKTKQELNYNVRKLWLTKQNTSSDYHSICQKDFSECDIKNFLISFKE